MLYTYAAELNSLNTVGDALFTEIINPAVLIFSSAAFVWFLYGVLNFYIAKLKSDEDGVKKGKMHMLYGLIGVAIIYSASGIFDFFYGLFLK